MSNSIGHMCHLLLKFYRPWTETDIPPTPASVLSPQQSLRAGPMLTQFGCRERQPPSASERPPPRLRARAGRACRPGVSGGASRHSAQQHRRHGSRASRGPSSVSYPSCDRTTVRNLQHLFLALVRFTDLSLRFRAAAELIALVGAA